jgi:hypothetical protein
VTFCTPVTEEAQRLGVDPETWGRVMRIFTETTTVNCESFIGFSAELCRKDMSCILEPDMLFDSVLRFACDKAVADAPRVAMFCSSLLNYDHTDIPNRTRGPWGYGRLANERCNLRVDKAEVIIAVHHCSVVHWCCLAVVLDAPATMYYYDSASGGSTLSNARTAFRTMTAWLRFEWTHQNAPGVLPTFTLVPDAQCPQQTNGIDCGMFVIEFARALIAAPDKRRPDFSVTPRQDMMPRLRVELAIDVLLHSEAVQARRATRERNSMYLDAAEALREAQEEDELEQLEAARAASLAQAEVVRRADPEFDEDLAAAMAASLAEAEAERQEDGGGSSDLDGSSAASFNSKTYDDSDGPGGDSDEQAGPDAIDLT